MSGVLVVIILLVVGIVAFFAYRAKQAAAAQQARLDLIRAEAETWVRQNQGKSPEPVACNFVLAKGEEAYYTSDACLYETRSVRDHGNNGMSVRVVRGVYLHSGRGQSESHEELRMISYGDFVVTNERILFNGETSRVIKLKNVVYVEALTPDQIKIVGATRQKPMIFLVGNAIIAKILIKALTR